MYSRVTNVLQDWYPSKSVCSLVSSRICFYQRPNPWISYINDIIIVLTAPIGGIAYIILVVRNPIEGIAYFRFYGIAIRRKN